MTITAKAIDEQPTAPSEAEIRDNVLVAIPLGNATEAEPPIIFYNENNTYARTGQCTRTSTATLCLAPMSISTPAMSYPAKLSCSAITSLVLGIVSILFVLFGFFFGILAIVFGVMAVQRIRSQPNEYGGLCVAYSGIVTGTIGMIFWGYIFVVIITYPPLATDAPAVAPT